MSINQRIEDLVKTNCNGNKSEFARIVGISPTVLENILGSRQGKPSYDVLLKILNSSIKVEADWLLGLDYKPNAIQQVTLNMNGIIKDDYLFLDNDEVEVFTNTNNNRFYVYSNGRIEIEVLKVPFPAYASYIECYQDEMNTINGFDSIRFKVDHIAKGNYVCFITEGESMNGGMLDDTPGGSEILAREIGQQFWDNLHGTKYGLVFVTKTGIMHKDIGGYNKETGMFTLLSRNKEHKPFEYPANDVYQIFNVIKRSF